MKLIALLFAFSFFQSAPSMKKEQEHPQKASPTQQAPKPTSESTAVVTTPVSQKPPKVEASDAGDKSNGWPPFTDVFWPTWVLVIVTGLAVFAALKTLGSINSQVIEMRKTGEQTDKLIAENINQSKSMERSVAQATRSANAMETVAKEIAVSSKAATASVTAIGQQMRAYICVVIGSAVYQERPLKKFQAIPNIINAGLTPAHKVSFRARAAILPVPLPVDFTFPLPSAPDGTSIIGPRQNITVSPIVEDFVDDAEVEGIKSGQQGRGLYAWGVFAYEDIFGKPQYTKFCHLYTWLGDGKTTWGYYDNRHNDAS